MIPAHRVRGEQLFRLWIVRCAGWQANHWHDAPPRATAIEPVDEDLLAAHEAASFLQGFNSAMLAGDRALWAVAVPIALHLEGDAQAGAELRGITTNTTQDEPSNTSAFTAQWRVDSAVTPLALGAPLLALAVPANEHELEGERAALEDKDDRAQASDGELSHFQGFIQSPQRSK